MHVLKRVHQIYPIGANRAYLTLALVGNGMLKNKKLEDLAARTTVLPNYHNFSLGVSKSTLIF